MDNLEIHLLNQLKILRKKLGLTLDELAQKAAVSAGQLSRIENLKVSPPLDTLFRIARALDIQPGDLFKNAAEDVSIRIIRNEHPVAHINKSKLIYHVPFYGDKNRLMEPFIMEIEHDRSEEPLVTHDGEECLYVMKGGVKLLYGRAAYTLASGEWAYFRAEVPHRVCGNGNVDALIWGVITSKDNYYHGDMSHILEHNHA